MNPYDEIDKVLNQSYNFPVTREDLEQYRDRLYTILEDTIEEARNGEYEDEED